MYRDQFEELHTILSKRASGYPGSKKNISFQAVRKCLPGVDFDDFELKLLEVLDCDSGGITSVENMNKFLEIVNAESRTWAQKCVVLSVLHRIRLQMILNAFIKGDGLRILNKWLKVSCYVYSNVSLNFLIFVYLSGIYRRI